MRSLVQQLECVCVHMNHYASGESALSFIRSRDRLMRSSSVLGDVRLSLEQHSATRRPMRPSHVMTVPRTLLGLDMSTTMTTTLFGERCGVIGTFRSSLRCVPPPAMGGE